MRTSTLTIRGTEYPCCFSTRVLLALEERGKREKPVKSATEMLSTIMEVEDYPAMFAAIGKAVTDGQAQTVEAEFPKNADTMQADLSD